MALCRGIRRRVTGSGGYGGNAQQASAADAATAVVNGLEMEVEDEWSSCR